MNYLHGFGVIDYDLLYVIGIDDVQNYLFLLDLMITLDYSLSWYAVDFDYDFLGDLYCANYGATLRSVIQTLHRLR